jgi:membrane protein
MMLKRISSLKVLVRTFISKVIEAQVPLLAAALAYYATFSLFPLLLLAVAGFGFALQARPELQTQVLEFMQNSIRTAFPSAADLLNDTLKDLKVSVLLRFQANAGATGAIGLLALFWAASGFFTVLQGALTQAIPGQRNRNVVMQRVVAFVSVFTLGPLLLLLMLVGTVLSSLGSIPALGILRTASSALLPLLGALILFALSYRFLPAHTPGWRASLIAAVPTALVWQLARQSLGWLTPVANFQATYGLLAGFLLLLAWLYLSMYIFLLGGVLTGLLEHREIESDALLGNA